MTTTTSHVVIGSGQIGTHITQQLIDAGQPVRVLTRSGSGIDHRLVTKVRVNVSDAQASRSAMTGAEVVYNCANPEYTKWATDFPPIQAGAVAGAAAAGAVYVTAGNLYMYGPSATLITEQTPYGSPAKKGRLRAEMTNELMALHQAGTLRLASIHGSDFFGPGATDSHVGDRFILKILAGKSVKVLGDPDAPHAFTYAPDMARAMIAAGTDERAWGRVWHAPVVATISQRALAQEIAAAAGTTAKVGAVPGWAVAALAKVNPMMRELAEMSYEFEQPFLIDDRAIATELGVTATPFAQALRETVAWFEARRAA
jgi:nucleoside-diphosphate-sugar epimerase